jgi:hypothetical protein
MKELLTPEEKQYLRRVSNYLGSMGMRDGNIEIDIDNGWTFSYDDINWEYVSHFANNYNADIPSGLIPILQKIMKYCDDEGLIKEHDEDINYQRLCSLIGGRITIEVTEVHSNTILKKILKDLNVGLKLTFLMLKFQMMVF